MLVDTVVATLTPIPLYVGPDQLLPLTSILGAVMGFLMIFWHRALAAVRRVRDLFTRTSAESRRTDA
ncbi:MAG: hypothetical protein H0V09_04630 [Gemmatimonadetes bacterium]|nr:hypothetical protein [Gemmatimonadota bacterium]